MNVSNQVKMAVNSKLISHSYPYISLLQAHSDKVYGSFHELAQELDQFVADALTGDALDYIRYPDSASLFSVEEEDSPVFMYSNPSSEEFDFYRLANLNTYSPNSHREKPSGIILHDESYVQMSFVFAHHIETMKMFLLFSSIHYGRSDQEKKEFYFFRFDKESDYMFEDSDQEPVYMEYKPVHHFHGKCDEPHFPSSPDSLQEIVCYVADLLKKNLKRIENKTGKAMF